MPIRVLGKTPERGRKEWNSPQRRKERQQQYMDKFGPRPPRRKRLTPADTTKRERDKKIENLHERMGGGTKAKPHSSREGRVASGKNRLDRYRKKAHQVQRDATRPKNMWKKRQPMQPLAKGGPAGRKGLTHKGKPTQTLRDLIKKAPKRRFGITERLGGSQKAKPHSTKEGRIAAGKRRFGRIVQRAPDPKRKPGISAPINPPKSPYIKDRVMTPLRAKKAVGGGVRKIGKRFLDFIKTGKHVDKDGVKVNVPKAAERLTGKPHVDHGKRKRIKHLGKGKAEGGRIGLKKGSVHTPGSHSWWLMNQSKPKRTKKAEGGRVNFRHGGSVGAAIKGHGAEIK